MTIYRFAALITISVITEVEAESLNAAQTAAGERSPAGFTNQPFAADEREAWIADELDGEPHNITFVGEVTDE